MEPLDVLKVKDLVVAFAGDQGELRAVDGVSFQIKLGNTLGLVGESGCGKSVTALAIMRLIPKPTGRIVSGEVIFGGQDLTKMNVDELHEVRGNLMGMVFQEPLSALNPVLRIGAQIEEVIRVHDSEIDDSALRQRCTALLQQVGIPAAERRYDDFPHQLSGGMRQRVVIAMALACEPELIIADEPTTALDVTIQAQILELLRELQTKNNMSLLMITHDFGVVAEMCDDVVVMYAGKVVESGPVADILSAPRHPYTYGLIASIPTPETPPKTKLPVIPGAVPSLSDLPRGCRFVNRCGHARDLCHQQLPLLENVNAEHQVACHRWKEIAWPKKS